MLKRQWISQNITTVSELNDMARCFNNIKPLYGAFDTETTGLHIIQDRPFVYQFGFLHPQRAIGYTYLVDIERNPQVAIATIELWKYLAIQLLLYMGHNVTFDLHMSANIGLPYTTENVVDTQFYIRYAHDAIAPEEGGPPLGLKDYAARYIDGGAKTLNNLLKLEQSQIARGINEKLKQRLAVCGIPPAKYKAKSYTLRVIDDMFKDPIFDAADLPDHIRQQYYTWLEQDVPDWLRYKVQGIVESDQIRYDKLNRETLYKYAHFDIIYTLETFEATAPVVQARGNLAAIKIEKDLVYPLWEMERVGFKIDKEYLEASRIRVKEYTKERRQLMYTLAGEELSVGQHARILTLLQEKFLVHAQSTGKEELDLLKSDIIREQPDNPAIDFIGVIQELRTLEKWYSTYIIRFQKELHYTDRLYTQINQVGTISGRVSSSFQQFPKEPIMTYDEQELFNPRKIVLVPGGDYNALVYIDYSQIELRFQAFYTILVGHPDLNLCRAYMPYKCINESGELFDYKNQGHINRWDQVWFLEEDNTQTWVPTDVHAKTTEAATGVHPDEPDFKKLRTTVGKKVNFAKNYGAQRGRIRSMFPRKTEEEITRIDQAYYKAFPGIKEYHNYCYGRAQGFTFTVNLFDVKYYGVSGHKLINLLIQGSSAFFLKIKIRELYDYSKQNNIKSRFQMNIHDELSWEKHKEDAEIFFTFQRIMQHWPDTIVPIVAEMDVSTTNWAEKKGVHSINEFHERFIV